MWWDVVLWYRSLQSNEMSQTVSHCVTDLMLVLCNSYRLRCHNLPGPFIPPCSMANVYILKEPVQNDKSANQSNDNS